ncbi:hypothetical protein McanMca71_005327 [Microsporum canis]|uniref:Peroxin 22-like protein n=1 Tax=Arthroderma otae (strain ATCC MYA-4605 / CBS 113480) TaxID=554155 RepID=C5G179_ARTOC|nr:conserved hypothetical protein [Microsporum canis CBS 113480]EEQ28542.1 conserved hypothetical protein [Microsporum canis CBS 113480]
MSEYNRGRTSGRSALGYWVPLVITVGVATAGLAAWVWSERQSDDDDEGLGYHDGNAPITLEPGSGDTHSRGVTTATDDGSMISRFQGAWRRTPSPKQFFDGASQSVVAGVAAAGAMVGGALSSIREEGGGEYDDHDQHQHQHQQQASEEFATQRGPDVSHQVQPVPGALLTDAALTSQLRQGSKKVKTVAIVVSSVLPDGDIDEQASGHASILAHLPEYIEPEKSRIFVLIYAPGVQPSAAIGQSRPTLSITSSYSNIASEEGTGAESSELVPLTAVDPDPITSDEPKHPSSLYYTLYAQAQALVDNETMIMPFSTPGGHIYILRHLSPEIVYIQESLAGNDGESVNQISGWVRQVVVVIGDEGGRGGLMDSDDESALVDKGERWWQKEGVTGLGKRITVVDGVRIGEEWKRRVCGHE